MTISEWIDFYSKNGCKIIIEQWHDKRYCVTVWRGAVNGTSIAANLADALADHEMIVPRCCRCGSVR